VRLAEWLGLATHEDDDADQFLVHLDWHRQQRSVRVADAIAVLRVSQDVRYVDRRARYGRAAGACRPVECMGMLSIVVRSRRRAAVRG
jgi:hypothetical protein